MRVVNEEESCLSSVVDQRGAINPDVYYSTYFRAGLRAMLRMHG